MQITTTAATAVSLVHLSVTAIQLLLYSHLLLSTFTRGHLLQVLHIHLSSSSSSIYPYIHHHHSILMEIYLHHCIYLLILISLYLSTSYHGHSILSPQGLYSLSSNNRTRIPSSPSMHHHYRCRVVHHPSHPPDTACPVRALVTSRSTSKPPIHHQLSNQARQQQLLALPPPLATAIATVASF